MQEERGSRIENQREPEVAQEITEFLVEALSSMTSAFSRDASATVSQDATLSSLGITSIDAIRLISMLEARWGVRVPVRKFFELTTLADVAKVAHEQRRRYGDRRVATSAGGVPAQVEGGRDRVSFQQEQMWVADRLREGAPVAQLPGWIRIRGALDFSALERAVSWLLKRHETLRDAYRSDGDAVYSVRVDGPSPERTLPSVALPIVRRDGETSLRYDEKARLERVREFAREPLDPTRAQVIRLCLLRYDDEDHDLALALHPLAADSASVDIALRDLVLAYRAYVDGRTPQAAAAVGYRQYAASQPLAGVASRRAKAAADDIGELPDSHWIAPTRARSNKANLRSSFVSRAVPSELSDRVRQIAVSAQTTPSGVWMSLAMLLAHRLSGRSQLVVGVPVSLRSERFVATLGNFLNTVPVISTFDPSITFEAFVARTSEALFAALDRADVPYDALARAFGERGHQGPLLRALFAVEERAVVAALPSGWEVKACGDAALMEQDMKLRLHGRNGRYFFEVAYREDLYSKAFVEDLATRFLWFSDKVSKSPRASLMEVPLLDAREQAAIRDLSEGPLQALPSGESVLHAIARQVAVRGGATAVIAPDGEMSYDLLWSRAEQVAHALVEGGVRRGEFVGVCLPRSTDLAAALVGVLRAGATLVPLDPSYPDARLRAMLDDSGVRFVVGGKPQKKRLATQERQVFLPDDMHTLAQPTSLPNFPESGEQAYLMYTSGSTGGPKGVVVGHEALLNHNMAYTRALQFRPGCRTLQFSSLSFDVSMQEFFPTLLAGGTAVYRANTFPEPHELYELVVEHEIEVLSFATAYWRAFTFAMSRARKALPGCVRAVVIGGESAPVSVFEHWRALAPRVQLINAYGSTEATIVSTYYDTAQGVRDGELPIGRPMQNQGAYVVGAFGDVLPRGAVGEIWLTGKGLSVGYWNRPAATKEAFGALRVAPDTEIRAYRTGDIGRWDEDGALHVVGRNDMRVKVRGVRVEPNEVELAMARIAGVQEAAVLATTARGREEEQVLIAAYVGDITENEVRLHLMRDLPSEMVPDFIAVRDSLPRLPNGKLDRKAMEEFQREPESQALVLPRNPTELALATIWKDVLGRERVGVKQDFFRIGGNSLSAIHAVDRANAAGLPLLPRDFLVDPTLAGLARAAEARIASQDAFDVLLTLDGRGTGEPLVFFHTLQGDLLSYGALVHHLGSRRPVYGIQSLGLRHPQSAHRNIEEMASHYAKRLIKAFGRERVHLVGSLFGGHVALETARAMAHLGHRQVTLCLIDTPPLEGPALRATAQVRALRRQGLRALRREAFRELRRQGLGELRSIVRARVLGEEPETTDPHDRFALEARSGVFANRAEVLAANREALGRYRTSPLDVALLLVKGESTKATSFESESERWSRYTQDLTTLELSGHGEALLREPCVAELANILNRWCDRQQVDAEGPEAER